MKDTDETAPDDLMESFRGRSLKSIIVFTIVIHAIVLGGTSVPFLMKSVMGKDTSNLSEDERVAQAVREATESLREIADEHGLNVQDISSQFAGGGSRSTRSPAKETTKTTDPATETEPEKEKSALEKELDVKAEGPELPKVEDDEEDLFK